MKDFVGRKSWYLFGGFVAIVLTFALAVTKQTVSHRIMTAEQFVDLPKPGPDRKDFPKPLEIVKRVSMTFMDVNNSVPTALSFGPNYSAGISADVTADTNHGYFKTRSGGKIYIYYADMENSKKISLVKAELRAMAIDSPRGSYVLRGPQYWSVLSFVPFKSKSLLFRFLALSRDGLVILGEAIVNIDSSGSTQNEVAAAFSTIISDFKLITVH